MKLSNPKRFAKIRARIRDLANSHRVQIEENTVIRVCAVLVGEAEWLVKELDRLSAVQDVPDEPLLAEDDEEEVEDTAAV